MRRAWLLCCAVAAAPAGAQVHRERVVVLESAIGAAPRELRAAVLDRLYSVLQSAPELEVVPRGELLDGELGREVRECGADLSCVSSLLRRARYDLSLELVLNAAAAPVVATIEWRDVRRGQVLGAAVVEAPASDLAAALGERVAELVEAGGRRVLGRLELQVEPREAKVTLHPSASPDPEAAGRYLLNPGTYRVLVSHPGYLAVEQAVTVERARATPLALKLEEEPSLLASPWLWLGVGVGLAAASAGLAVVLAPEPEQRYRLCHSSDPAACP